MAKPNRNGGALAKVRLTQIDLAVRRRVGQRLLDQLVRELGPYGLEQAAELHKAVETPSDREYFVSREAYERVMGP